MEHVKRDSETEFRSHPAVLVVDRGTIAAMVRGLNAWHQAYVPPSSLVLDRKRLMKCVHCRVEIFRPAFVAEHEF